MSHAVGALRRNATMYTEKMPVITGDDIMYPYSRVLDWESGKIQDQYKSMFTLSIVSGWHWHEKRKLESRSYYEPSTNLVDKA
jgi:hypothetical protein